MQMHARQREGTEALACAAPEPQPQRCARSPATVYARDIAGDARADGQVMISDRDHARDRVLPLENLGIERYESGTNVPLEGAPAWFRFTRRGGQQCRQIEQARAWGLRTLDPP